MCWFCLDSTLGNVLELEIPLKIVLRNCVHVDRVKAVIVFQ